MGEVLKTLDRRIWRSRVVMFWNFSGAPALKIVLKYVRDLKTKTSKEILQF